MKTLGALVKPHGITEYPKSPYLVQNTVLDISSTFTRI